MGTILGQDIADQAARVLNDESNVTWSAAELLDWINAGQRAIVVLKPNAATATVNLSLVEGTKQALPASYHALVEVVRNMGAGGTTPGAAIRPMERRYLDVAFPDWHLSTYADSAVQGFWQDETNRSTFYVYPPQPASTTQQVEANVVAPPSDLSALAAVISLADVYEGAMVDYVLFRAFSKDTTSPQHRTRAEAAYQRLLQGLGLHTQVENAYTETGRDKEGAAA